jgi:type III secretion protein V
MEQINRFLRAAAQRQDIVFAVFFIMIVAMLIIPLPHWLIDTLLAINLTLALLILLTSIYLKHTLDISTFPSIILVTAIFRVALSVATTRLILAFGDAGYLITAFGNFVIGGNIVVGLVVFLIVAVVQFMVVTKGAERISEVGARFTLDAMPGKQMAIDADLRAGDITKEDAKRRRSNLEQEMSFHGSMDGAMRFVKGDAIASLIIVFVNLIGGLLIGMLQRGMPFAEASKLYTLLSVGDGLIAQIPAMFIALAAGVVVTRVENEESTNMGADISRQLFNEPRAMGMAGVVAVAMGFLPGFPTLVFLIIGGVLTSGAYFLDKRTKALVIEKQKAAEAAAAAAAAQAPDLGETEPAPSEKTEEEAPQRVPLRIATPGDVLVLRGSREFLNLFEFMRVFRPILQARERFTRKFGFPSPPMGFQYDSRVRVGDLITDIDDVPTARLSLEDVDPQGQLSEDHIRDIARYIFRQWNKNAAAMFSTQQASTWLSGLEEQLGRLVSDVQQMLPFMTLVNVLRKLLEEGVGLTPPRLVLEGIMQSASRSQEPELIADLTRAFLKRQICHNYASDGRIIEAYLVSPEYDEVFQAIRGGGRANEQVSGLFVRKVKNLFKSNAESNIVILTSGDIRRTVRKLLTDQGVDAPVLGYNEISRDYEVKNLGVIDTNAANAG